MQSSSRAPFIMYVDDDPDDLLIISETMQQFDPFLRVHGFTNSREAFTFLESISDGDRLPSLIILDFNMPLWNGLQMLEAIKANSAYQDIPVLIFTNSDHPRHRELSLSKGAIDFLTKPYGEEELQKTCSRFASYVTHPVF